MRKTGMRRKAAGFYLAMAVSVAALGAVAWLMSAELETEKQPSPQLTASVPSSEPTEEVLIPKRDVPKEESSSRPENYVVSFPKETERREESSESGSLTAELPVEDVETAAPAENIPKEEEKPLTWASPVDGGKITNPYSGGELVKSRTLGEWRTHDGIDISAAEGDAVKAAADGVVKDVRKDNRWGWTIEIEHGGAADDVIVALYCGLDEAVKAAVGQQVKQGDVIGKVGNSSVMEASEEPHIHLGMKQGGKWIDPAEVLGF
ncbi:MAG: M23 family metallopeptidase [Oscillospiraceae bacterium]|nr:M23 family metallopeptidase [Oscillospiraceae bacterium]